jgi:hypothetical protein
MYAQISPAPGPRRRQAPATPLGTVQTHRRRHLPCLRVAGVHASMFVQLQRQGGGGGGVDCGLVSWRGSGRSPPMAPAAPARGRSISRPAGMQLDPPPPWPSLAAAWHPCAPACARAVSWSWCMHPIGRGCAPQLVFMRRDRWGRAGDR